jgi:cyclopropane-fatty-acyl-phospholipid synthase
MRRRLLKKILQAVGAPASPIVLWDGETLFQQASPSAPRLVIRDRRALARLLIDPGLQFGRLYAAGRIDIQGEPVVWLEALYRRKLQRRRQRPIGTTLPRGLRVRRNNRHRARDNIQHHYDIGNSFYRLWLDRELVYTCAYFPNPSASLEAAQMAKMDHVCRKLRLRPGEKVVDAGCGWGALALHMAREYGVTVKAYNISHEQIVYARRRAQEEGLGQRVEFIEQDYREITGNFDVFASIGMLEHVGPGHYRSLGRLIDRCLRERGRGLIHSIGTDRPGPLNPWIERHIFPGAYPPSLGEMASVFEAGGLSVLDVENLRLHYAKTLEYWLARFEAAFDRVVEMYDPAFARAWRLYLAGSTAAFRTGQLQLFQVLFTRSGDNEIPWTRDYMYTDRHLGADPAQSWDRNPCSAVTP